MPIFDFRCDACEKVVEVFIRGAETVIVCENCNAPMHRQIARTSFVLKGGGWAKDGYGTPKSPPPKD